MSEEQLPSEPNEPADLGEFEQLTEQYENEIRAHENRICNLEDILRKPLELKERLSCESAIRAHGKKISELEAALKSKNGPLKLRSDGAVLLLCGDYVGALDAYNKLIELCPKSDDVWDSKGGVLIDLKRYDEAVDAFSKAAEINPKSWRAWHGKGHVLRLLGRHTEAIESYDKAIDINPKSWATWHNKGYALADLKRYDDAINSYRMAIDCGAPNKYVLQNRIKELEGLLVNNRNG